MTVLKFVVKATVALVSPYKPDMVVMSASAFLKIIQLKIAITVISRQKKGLSVVLH